MTEPTPFQITVSDELLTWINQRVKSARIPPGNRFSNNGDDTYGLPTETAKRLHTYWTEKYDWRAAEAKLNAEFTQYTLPIEQDGETLTIHFAHHRSSAPDAIPLLLLHGWPGNFSEPRKIIGELTSPQDGRQAFHVVSPSLAGFGFSSYPSEPFSLDQHAAVVNKLMLALGYTRYVGQGHDWGSIILRVMALNYPQHCVGLHLNMIFAGMPAVTRQPVKFARLLVQYSLGLWSAYEKKMLDRQQRWLDDDYGYSQISSTRPQTLAYALCDSPFGMLCWMYEVISKVVSLDTAIDEEWVITWAMLYIVNGSPGNLEIYTNTHGARMQELKKRLLERTIESSVPLGVSIFPTDPCYCTRWWAEGNVAHNISFWKEHATGGRYASIEQPQVLLEDLQAFIAASGLQQMKWS